MSCLQGGLKASLRGVFQGQGKRFQLACRKTFGMADQVTIDDLHLVKLGHVDNSDS